MRVAALLLSRHALPDDGAQWGRRIAVLVGGDVLIPLPWWSFFWTHSPGMIMLPLRSADRLVRTTTAMAKGFDVLWLDFCRMSYALPFN